LIGWACKQKAQAICERTTTNAQKQLCFFLLVLFFRRALRLSKS